MRKLSALALALSCSLTGICQKEAPSYGKVDKEDLLMTSCAFDPEADACVLIKTGETTFVIGSEVYLQTQFRYRIKILKDKGVDRANIKLDFYSNQRTEDITNISGETTNLEAGNTIVKSKLEKKNIYTKALDKNWSEISFSLPDVKKGSVFEYKFTKLSKNFTDIDNWYFQSTIPTAFCQFYLSIPKYFDFTYHIHRTLPMDVKDQEYQEAIKVFTMTNIPGLREEPYMSAPRDYMQHIDFQLAAINIPGEPTHTFNTNWPKLNETMLENEDFGGQLHKNVPHTKALDAHLTNIKDSSARMSIVYNYVRQNMDWNGYEGIYSADGIKSAWDKKSGNVADINLTLVNLLRDAGLDAHPILVSTRDHGHVNVFYPLLSQFNETMAYVRIGDKYYVLNAADKYNPIRLVPYDVQYTEGYVVDKDNPGWVALVDDDDEYRNVVVLTGVMDSSGKMDAEARISNFDYSRNLRCKNYKEGVDKFKETYFTKEYTNLTIDSLEVNGQDNDSMPLNQVLHFNSQLNGSGQYLFFSPNLFLGLEKNPFLAEHRFTDVDFGYRQSYMIVGSLEIPDGYAFETLPKNMRLIMQDTSIYVQRLMQVDENRLSFRIQVEFKRPVYYTTEYDDFREFYKKLYATLNEQIVIRKKS